MITREDTRVEMTDIVLPGDTNHHGTIFGGKVMSMVDICGAIAASKFCRMPVVTAAVDNLNFTAPIKSGQVIKLIGHVNAAFEKSMEIEVNVSGEDLLTGEVWQTTTAYLTFVAVVDGKSQKLGKLEEGTLLGVAKSMEAHRRRELRMANRENV